MTGYGKASAALPGGKLTVEIRSLNSKSADINIKTNLIPKDKEIALRKKIQERLVRGTIDLYMTWEAGNDASVAQINSGMFRSYMNELLCLDPKLDRSVVAASVLRLPDVVENKKADIIDEASWPLVETAVDEALGAICAYRSTEGEALYKDVTSRVGNILELYSEVEKLEGERIEAVKERILKNLEELAQKPDMQRFEQELIFYLEKYDINEEKVRLRQHCRYFMETIDTEEYPGKKLGFIIQEMGREINTTGSKANHAGIQRLVVKMKDELEKIREQSMNIL